MTASGEFSQQFQSIDAAISRDITRRRRNHLISWVLVLAAAGVAVYAVLTGGTETQLVARQLSGDSGFTANVAASAQVRRTVVQEAQRLTESEAFASNLVRSPAIERQIEAVVEHRVSEVRQEVEENRATIQSFDRRLDELSAAGGRRFTPPDTSRIERRELSEMREAQRTREAEMRAEIGRLSEDLEALRRELQRVR